MNLLTYLMLTIVINYVCGCTIWGYYPLGIPAVLTAQYIILNLKCGSAHVHTNQINCMVSPPRFQELPPPL